MNVFYKGVNIMISLFFPNNPLIPLSSSGKNLICSEQSFERDMIDQLHLDIGWSS